jgi:hypothetical protein
METGHTGDSEVTILCGGDVTLLSAKSCSFGTRDSTCPGKGSLCCRPGNSLAIAPQCAYLSVQLARLLVTDQSGVSANNTQCGTGISGKLDAVACSGPCSPLGTIGVFLDRQRHYDQVRNLDSKDSLSVLY